MHLITLSDEFGPKPKSSHSISAQFRLKSLQLPALSHRAVNKRGQGRSEHPVGAGLVTWPCLILLHSQVHIGFSQREGKILQRDERRFKGQVERYSEGHGHDNRR